MKFKKSVAVLALAALLLSSVGAAEVGAEFSDVPEEHWAAHNIAWCSHYGLMQGVGGGRFGLGEQMTRASYVMTLCRLMGWSTEGGETGSFEDNQDPQKWYYGAIEEAFSRGVLTKQSTLCRPDEAITREEMAVMTVRALGYTTLAGLVSAECPFADVSANQGYITLAYRMGVTNGTGRFTFNPKATATREEAATMLLRLYNRINNGISLSYGEVGEDVPMVESLVGTEGELPLSPRAPMEKLYELALTGTTRAAIDGRAFAQNVTGGAVGEGRYITDAELTDYLSRGTMRRSTRYESTYVVCPEEDGSTTVVWFESEADIQRKVLLCRCLGITELYVKR